MQHHNSVPTKLASYFRIITFGQGQITKFLISFDHIQCVWCDISGRVRQHYKVVIIPSVTIRHRPVVT